MSAGQVGTRYATALLEEAKSQGVLEDVFRDFKLLEKTYQENRELRNLLLSPIVNVDKKKAVMKAVYSGKITDLTERFLNMLMHKRRESFFAEVVKAFFIAYNETMNIKEVELVSADTISPVLEKRIVDFIQKQLGDVTLNIKKMQNLSLALLN